MTSTTNTATTEDIKKVFVDTNYLLTDEAVVQAVFGDLNGIAVVADAGKSETIKVWHIGEACLPASNQPATPDSVY